MWKDKARASARSRWFPSSGPILHTRHPDSRLTAPQDPSKEFTLAGLQEPGRFYDNITGMTVEGTATFTSMYDQSQKGPQTLAFQFIMVTRSPSHCFPLLFLLSPLFGRIKKHNSSPSVKQATSSLSEGLLKTFLEQ